MAIKRFINGYKERYIVKGRSKRFLVFLALSTDMDLTSVHQFVKKTWQEIWHWGIRDQHLFDTSRQVHKGYKKKIQSSERRIQKILGLPRLVHGHGCCRLYSDCTPKFSKKLFKKNYTWVFETSISFLAWLDKDMQLCRTHKKRSLELWRRALNFASRAPVQNYTPHFTRTSLLFEAIWWELAWMCARMHTCQRIGMNVRKECTPVNHLNDDGQRVGPLDLHLVWLEVRNAHGRVRPIQWPLRLQWTWTSKSCEKRRWAPWHTSLAYIQQLQCRCRLHLQKRADSR